MRTKILVADNDDELLDQVGTYLRGSGFTVILAKSLPQAKRKLQEEDFDLAILDVRLRDDEDDKDKSGLMLAKTYAPLKPKIILTARPTYPRIRESLSQVGGVRAAIDLVPKEGGLPTMLMAVRNAVTKAEDLKKIEELRQGDSAAWEKLWDDEAWRLISLARRHGASEDEAQTVCDKVFRNLASAKTPPRGAALSAVLAGETLREVKSLAKKRGAKTRRRVKAVADAPDREMLLEDLIAPAVEQRVSKDELLKRIKKAIMELPENEQALVVRYLFTASPAARAPGGPVALRSAVKKRLNKAVASLKDKLAELE